MADLERLAHERDARLHYWRRFPITVNFSEPCEVVGRLVQLAEHQTSQGPAPKLKIRQRDGFDVYVIATQTQLLRELRNLMPVVGDVIKIIYKGEASRAAPGMRPTKEFEVRIKPPEPDEAAS